MLGVMVLTLLCTLAGCNKLEVTEGRTWIYYSEGCLDKINMASYLDVTELTIHASDRDYDWSDGDYVTIDFEALKGFENLETIHFSGITNLDLQGIETVTSLRQIEIDGACEQIRNIESMGGCSGLESLRIRYSQLEDLSFLKNLSALKNLKLAISQNIENFEVIGTLAQLESVDLEATNIGDIEFISSLDHLKSLRIKGGTISKVDAISSLDQLEILTLSGLEVSSIDGLRNLSQLKELTLDGCPITSVEPIKDLVNLEELYIVGCSMIEDLDLLSQTELSIIQDYQPDDQ